MVKLYKPYSTFTSIVIVEFEIVEKIEINNKSFYIAKHKSLGLMDANSTILIKKQNEQIYEFITSLCDVKDYEYKLPTANLYSSENLAINCIKRYIDDSKQKEIDSINQKLKYLKMKHRGAIILELETKLKRFESEATR